MARRLEGLTRDDVVQRATGAVGKATRYALGRGGRDPAAAHPAQGRACDCSGFAAWCVGVDRYLPNAAIPDLPEQYGWFETTALYADARSPWGFVTEIPWTAALPGDLLVWPDAGGRQGHVGVVVQADHAGPAAVAHCAASHWRKHGDAIRVTSPELFLRNRAVAARVRWLA